MTSTRKKQRALREERPDTVGSLTTVVESQRLYEDAEMIEQIALATNHRDNL